MDVTGIDVLIPAGAAIGGLVLGALLGRTGRGDKNRLEELEVRVSEREGQIAQLEAARSELATRLAKSEREREEVSEQLTGYRNEVTSHFTETSELLKEMTLQYRSIYQHLAEGAEALCPEGTLRLDTHAPIETLAAEAADAPAEDEDVSPSETAVEDSDSGLESELPPRKVDAAGDEDGTSVEAAHTDPPVQVDPRPES